MTANMSIHTSMALLVSLAISRVLSQTSASSCFARPPTTSPALGQVPSHILSSKAAGPHAGSPWTRSETFLEQMFEFAALNSRA
eukprot:CAMPEP_0181445272 /NCGR_PEP_ID=MMETSP1110-20121109/25501_1 /TAXON_ID=174948 /ORGANISM="Symbiodinium sp., Strain CCMP421" /LENGTH=83 /DNA_ID=CAMNT_0023569309 /DNA_START=102 /DNA_END=353 /DNA_ORIENTATION=-